VSPSTRGCDAGGSGETDGRYTAYAGITLDVLVIYALTVHGKETKAEYG
jgi:hypothetical protein